MAPTAKVPVSDNKGYPDILTQSNAIIILQGGSQKLLLTTKESIVSISIFFWATLYCFFTLHWILFGLRVKLLDTRLFFTREHLLTSVIAHGFVKFRCIHRQTAISKYRTILKLKLEFLQHLFSLIPLCRKDIVIDCGSMY